MARTRTLCSLLCLALPWAGCTQSAAPDRSAPSFSPEDEESDDDDDTSSPRPSFDAGARRAPPPPERLDSLIVADRPPPPISGGSLAVSADGTRAVAADPDRDAVYVVEVATETASTVTLPEGSEPGRTVFDGSGHAHVALRSADAVVSISLDSPEVRLQTRVCQHPRGLAYDAVLDAIWVACANGELVSLAAKSHAELTRKFVALDLRDIVITAAGERFVSRYRSAELLRVAQDGSIVGTSTPRTTTAQNLDRPDVKMSPTLAWRTVSTGDGKIWMLHQQSQDDEVVIRPGGYGGGCQTITQPSVTQYDANGQPIVTTSVGGSALAVDVAISPDGQQLAVAAPGAYLQGARGSLQILPLVVLGVGADAGVLGGKPFEPGVAQDAGVADAGKQAGAVDAGQPTRPTGRNLPCGPLTGQMPNHQATAVAFDTAGRLYVFSREPAALTIFAARSNVGFGGAAPEQTIALSERSMRDTGHELFHADVGSGLACASCHGEALDDGHVWTFAEIGPRRTQNMRGGLLSTLPLHWEGDMPTFQHLVDEVMTGRMGGFQVEPKYANALANWIDAQPELRLEGADASAIERGKTLFESDEVACATCHAGEQLTNNESFDVGTGGKLQVPSLRGLALRAPFMHDGCAATLAARFDESCGGADQHGKTSQLSEAQLADLVAYLETL